MTSQEITFEAMNSYFLMANNKINESYLNHRQEEIFSGD